MSKSLLQCIYPPERCHSLLKFGRIFFLLSKKKKGLLGLFLVLWLSLILRWWQLARRSFSLHFSIHHSQGDSGVAEMETDTSNNQESGEVEKMSKSLKKFLLIVNSALLATGCCVGPLVQRLYFLKGGKSVWISCFLETAGWPFIIFPLIASYFFRRRKNSSMTKLFYITPHLFLACAVIGVLTGLDDFLAAYGVSLLPVSTYSLIIATQLGFTAAFAFILVKQKFTPFTINAIFLLTIGAFILVLHASSDRPAHETNKQYFIGFFMTLGASVLYGFVLPLMELTYKKAKQTITYTLVMEMQMVLSFFASAFCAIGMLLHKDFAVFLLSFSLSLRHIHKHKLTYIFKNKFSFL
ncbi:purine permease 3 isoform X1 [Manihot esculenta]|uniref:purine permease 3 isoform X1 n=1 Tax=Manihot esculenta TaxID=3983 RepID=UPI000B5D2ECF|nr:purine permease 3 isoform X1 [Manihot esculenta]